MERLGFRGPFFGGFKQKYGRECGRSNGGSAVPRVSLALLGVFFSVKTSKKHFQKCQICPKQVGMDSQAKGGFVMSKNMPFFGFFLEKSLFCPTWPKREKSRFFTIFFSIFCILGWLLGRFSAHRPPVTHSEGVFHPQLPWR